MRASKEIAKKLQNIRNSKEKSMICTKSCKGGLPKEILKIYGFMDSG